MGVLAYNIHVTYNGIASALASRSAGGFLNNVVCGIFQRFVNNYQDLMLTIGFIVPTIRTIDLIFFSRPINAACSFLCSCSCDAIYQIIVINVYCILCSWRSIEYG